MEPRTFDALTRRASLLTLGSAGLAALTLPRTAAAKKNRKNRNKEKGDVNKLCKSQVGQCETFVTALCEDINDPECVAVLACCAPLASCDFNGFIACLEAAQELSATGLARR